VLPLFAKSLFVIDKLEFFACLAFHKEIIIKLIINQVCTLILEQWSVISQKPVEKVLIIPQDVLYTSIFKPYRKLSDHYKLHVKKKKKNQSSIELI